MSAALCERNKQEQKRWLRVVSLKWLQLGSGASFLRALLVPNLTIHWTDERKGLTILLKCRPNCDSEYFQLQRWDLGIDVRYLEAQVEWKVSAVWK